MAKFTLEQKLDAVKEYLQGNRSYRDIAKTLSTNHKAIMKWVRQYEAHGVDGLISRYTNYFICKSSKVWSISLGN
jgi:transposase